MRAACNGRDVEDIACRIDRRLEIDSFCARREDAIEVSGITEIDSNSLDANRGKPCSVHGCRIRVQSPMNDDFVVLGQQRKNQSTKGRHSRCEYDRVFGVFQACSARLPTMRSSD